MEGRTGTLNVCHYPQGKLNKSEAYTLSVCIINPNEQTIGSDPLWGAIVISLTHKGLKPREGQ